MGVVLFVYLTLRAYQIFFLIRLGINVVDERSKVAYRLRRLSRKRLNNVGDTAAATTPITVGAVTGPYAAPMVGGSGTAGGATSAIFLADICKNKDKILFVSV